MKWNNFQKSIRNSFKNLRENSDFSDVTLVCEDNQQVEAHRVILSACSPFFMNVLKNNKHSHPMIYMRGLKAQNMLSVLDFMYHGEASIYIEDLEHFLALADDLQLIGVTGNTEEQIQGVSDKNITEKAFPIKEIKLPKQIQTKEEVQDGYEILVNPKMNLLKGEKESFDTLDEQINFMMQGEPGNWTCSVCWKNSKLKDNIRQHIEGHHVKGITHPCSQCNTVSRSRIGLSKHVMKNHTFKD